MQYIYNYICMLCLALMYGCILFRCSYMYAFNVLHNWYNKDFILNMFRYIVLTTYLLYITYNENFIFNIFFYHNLETKSYREYSFNLNSNYFYLQLKRWDSMTQKKVYPFLKYYNFSTNWDILNLLILFDVEFNCISLSASINENT